MRTENGERRTEFHGHGGNLHEGYFNVDDNFPLYLYLPPTPPYKGGEFYEHPMLLPQLRQR